MLSIFLVGFSGKLSKYKCLLMGILCGLAYLARTQLVFLPPLAVLYIWISIKKERKLFNILLLLFAFLFVVSPWFVRNTLITGKPAFSFLNSRAFVWDISLPLSDLEKQLTHDDLEMPLEAPVETSEVLKEYGPAIAEKIWRNLLVFFSSKFWADNFVAEGVFLFFLFASIVYRRRSGNSSYVIFRYSVVILILCFFLISCIVKHVTRYYIPLQPFICIVGVNEILMLIRDLGLRHAKKLQLATFCCLLLFGSVGFYNSVMRHKNRPPSVSVAEKKSYEFIKAVASRGTIVASNVSYRISLYAGCRTVRLPVFPVDLLKINDSYLPIDYVLINRRIAASYKYKYANYGEFIKSEAFLKRFKFMKVLADGSILFKRLS
jgi:4-amino-4-deoxy-L-arabinose transferase-like glycosyltransferase